MPSSSTRRGRRWCRASSIPTRISSSPAIAATSCSAVWPAPATPRSRRAAAASSRPSPRHGRATEGGAGRRARCRGWQRCWRAAPRPRKSRAATGWTLETELRMLRAIRTLGRASADRARRRRSWARTRFPLEYPRPPRRYVRLVMDEMIPAVAARRARRMVRRVLRTAASSRPRRRTAILEAAQRHGLKARHPCRRARAERRLGGGR